MEQLTIPRYEVDIFWSDEDDAFVAVVPDLPYCSAWGDTYEEALSQVQSAIRGHIKVAQKYGDPIPEPRPPREIDGADPVPQPEEVSLIAAKARAQDTSLSYGTALRTLADQQRALQDLVQESGAAYADFLNSAFSFYQQALQQATQVAQSTVQTAGQVAQQSVQAAGQTNQQTTQAATQAAQESANAASQVGQASANAAGQTSQKIT